MRSMVEGGRNERGDRIGDAGYIPENIRCRHPHHLISVLHQKPLPFVVALRSAVGIMDRAVDLDDQSPTYATKIDDIGADRMLAPEL